jgi:hypothetical protein
MENPPGRQELVSTTQPIVRSQVVVCGIHPNDELSFAHAAREDRLGHAHQANFV